MTVRNFKEIDMQKILVPMVALALAGCMCDKCSTPQAPASTVK